MSTTLKPIQIPPDRGQAIASLAADIGDQGQTHTMACLQIGYYVHEAHRLMAIGYGEVAAAMRSQGLEAPSASRVSVYLHAYRAWHDSGIEWDDLSKFSIDTLYHAGRLIGRMDNVAGRPITPDDALRFAKLVPPADLRAMSKKGGVEAWPNQPDEVDEPSDVATVKMPRAAVEAWDAFAERVGRVTGGAVSRTKALEFALMLMSGLDDELLEAAWDGEHGDTPDPSEAEPFVVIDDEEDFDGGEPDGDSDD